MSYSHKIRRLAVFGALQQALAAVQQQEQQQARINAQQAQPEAASQQRLGEYNRAFQTCMQGRGYAMSY